MTENSNSAAVTRSNGPYGVSLDGELRPCLVTLDSQLIQIARRAGA